MVRNDIARWPLQTAGHTSRRRAGRGPRAGEPRWIDSSGKGSRPVACGDLVVAPQGHGNAHRRLGQALDVLGEEIQRAEPVGVEAEGAHHGAPDPLALEAGPLPPAMLASSQSATVSSSRGRGAAGVASAYP